MKRLVPLLLMTLAAFAAEPTPEGFQVKTTDQLATAPADYSGPAEGFSQWALSQKPTLLNNEVVVNRAIDVSLANLTVKWRLDGANSFQDQVAEVSASGMNSIYNEQSEEQVKQKTEYYTSLLDQKINPLIDHIEGEVQKPKDGENTSTKSMKNFMLQGGGEAGNTFFGKFFKRIQEPYNDVLGTLFLFFTFFALVFILIDMTTNKQHNWKMEWIRRGVIGVPIIFIFFTNSSNTTTRAQDYFAGFLSYSTGIADAIANHAHVSNAESVIVSVAKPDGVNVKQIEEQVKKLVTEDQKAEIYAGILNSCVETWDVEKLKTYRSSKSNNMFPASPASLGKSNWEFENEFLKSSALNTGSENVAGGSGSYYSIGTCAATESAYKEYASAKKTRDLFFQKVIDFNPGDIKSIAVSRMNTNISYGWISVALLPAQQAMANEAPTNIQKNLEKSAWDKVSFNSINDVESFAKELEKFDISRTVDSFSQRFAFMMVPGVSGIFDASKSLLTSVVDLMMIVPEAELEATRDAAQTANIATFFIPGAANVTAGATGAALKAIAVVKSALSSTGAFYLATGAGKMIIESLVYLSMVAVIGIAIALWYLEVFIYTITLPFASLYAFGENSRQNIIEKIIQGIGIALKPALIVIFVLVALQVGAFFETTTAGMITKQDLMLMSKANATLASTELSWSNPLAGYGEWLISIMNKSLIMAILFIVTAVAKVWLMIYVVLKAPGMALEYFGRHIDSSHMVESINQRGQQFSGGL